MAFVRTQRANVVWIKQVSYEDGSGGYMVELLIRNSKDALELIRCWCSNEVKRSEELKEVEVSDFDDSQAWTFKIAMSNWKGETKQKIVQIDY